MRPKARTLPPSTPLLIIPLLIIIITSTNVMGATLQGSIYTPDLKVARDVLLTISTTPMQRLLSTDGTYRFSVPPGNYTLSASYAHGETNETTTENIIIIQEGEFTFDLFLFPDIKEDNLSTQLEEDLAEPPFNPKPFPWVQLLLLLMLLALGLFGIWKGGRKEPGEREEIAKRAGRTEKNDKKEEEKEKSVEDNSGEEKEDELVKRVISIIKKEGGRMTQKELRKELPMSEAKVSLMVNELVARGRIEKLKRGRGNILVLK